MQRAIRAIRAILAVVASAPPAAAATISIEATVDAAIPGDPGPGDTITLTVTAVVEEGEIAPGDQMRVIVNHDLSIVSANGGSTMGTLTQLDGAAPAVTFSLQGLCAWAIGRDNQIVNISGMPVDAAVLTAVLTDTYTGIASRGWPLEGGAAHLPIGRLAPRVITGRRPAQSSADGSGSASPS